MIGEERNPTNPQEEQDEDALFEAYLNEADKEKEPAPEPAAKTEPAPEPKHWIDEIADENIRTRARQEYEAEHKARLDAENRHKAQLGQLKPTQQALESARKETAALKEQLAKIPKPADVSAAAWEKYKGEMIDDAKAIESFVAPIGADVQTLKTQLQEMRQFQEEMKHERAREQDVQKVREIHPDLDDIDSDPIFGQWLDDALSDDPEKQDPVIASVYAAQGGKFTAAQGAWLITQYKRDVALFEKTSPAPAISPKATATVARREQQKQTPTTAIKTGQSAQAGRSNVTGDPKEDAFAEYLAANPI